MTSEHGIWSLWFAWRPIWIDNEDITAIVWLEKVWRRWDGRRWEYELNY